LCVGFLGLSIFRFSVHSQWFTFQLFYLSVCFLTLGGNGLPLAAVGDFEALNCQPSTNVDRSTALDLTTSAPIAANGCYAVGFLFRSVLS